jgi:hypothetical protein
LVNYSFRARSPIRDHGPPGEAVGKDSANSSGNACSPDETEEVIGCYSLQYPDMHGERHSEAERMTLKLSAAFFSKKTSAQQNVT